MTSETHLCRALVSPDCETVLLNQEVAGDWGEVLSGYTALQVSARSLTTWRLKSLFRLREASRASFREVGAAWEPRNRTHDSNRLGVTAGFLKRGFDEGMREPVGVRMLYLG